MAIGDALVFPGNSSDRAYLSAMAQTWRTNNGTAWFFGAFVRLDSLDPGENGWIADSRRASNNAVSSGLQYRDSNNRFRGTYNASPIGEITTSPSATTWYFVTMSNTGASLANVIRYHSLAGSQVDTVTTSNTSSTTDDGNTQEVTLGARYNGTSTSDEWRGRMWLPIFVWTAVPSQSEQEEFAADPLNKLVEWIATYGAANVVALLARDGSGHVDQGSNGETITLTGGVTLGSANGPTVPDLVGSGGTNPALTSLGKKSLAFYDLELAVPYSGTNLGEDPLIELTSDSLGLSNLVAQTVRTSSDTGGTFDCAIGSLTPGAMYLKLTNAEVGHASEGLSTLVGVEVRADSGAGVVVARRTIPTQNNLINVAIPTFDGAGEFHCRNAQESLTYSVASGDLPDGLSLSGSTISGTIDSGAAAGSPYTSNIRATDSNGDWVEQVLSWIVTVAVATGKAVGSWGRRGRRP